MPSEILARMIYTYIGKENKNSHKFMFSADGASSGEEKIRLSGEGFFYLDHNAGRLLENSGDFVIDAVEIEITERIPRFYTEQRNHATEVVDEACRCDVAIDVAFLPGTALCARLDHSTGVGQWPIVPSIDVARYHHGVAGESVEGVVTAVEPCEVYRE